MKNQEWTTNYSTDACGLLELLGGSLGPARTEGQRARGTAVFLFMGTSPYLDQDQVQTQGKWWLCNFSIGGSVLEAVFMRGVGASSCIFMPL